MVKSLIKKIHSVSILRKACRYALAGITIRQPFHGGVIFLDAVEHSWAWTGDVRYESFDSALQEKLLELAATCDVFLDIGCNVGTMMLSVALRNASIRGVCIDPNPRAIQLVGRSLAANGLSGRVDIVGGALAPAGADLRFDTCGSVTGHVCQNGGAITRGIVFSSLVNEYVPRLSNALVKIDIEGFESIVVDDLLQGDWLHRMTLLVELHPVGFNSYGDPCHVLGRLIQSGAFVTDLNGEEMRKVNPRAITQIIARWPDV